MKRFTVDHQPGIKVVRLNLFKPYNDGCVRQVIRAGPGKILTAMHIEDILDQACEKIEQNLPGHEYTMIQVSPGVFNFVWKSGTDEHTAPLQSESTQAP